MLGERILFIHPSDENYGADRVLLDILDSLPDTIRRERVCVWLPNDLPHGPNPLCRELGARGVSVEHLPLPILRRAYRTPRGLAGLSVHLVQLRRRIRRLAPDVVYCTTSAAFLAAPAARAARVPVVLGHVQELWADGDVRPLEILGRACHGLIAISDPVRAALPARLRERTEVVLNATAEPPRVVSLTEHEGPLRFLVASRWNAWKGHRTLLAAWDQVDTGSELVVLGGPPASGESVDVPLLVSRLRHPDSVRLVGEVPDIGAQIEAADVMVVPSDSPEPFGLVAIEALARGRPVIGSRGGGLADIITDGHDGWLYPLGDAERLADLLGGLTREDVAVAGKAARDTYEERYTHARFAESWRRTVEGFLSRR